MATSSGRFVIDFGGNFKNTASRTILVIVDDKASAACGLATLDDRSTRGYAIEALD